MKNEMNEWSRRLTTKQWYHFWVTSAPTASNVAISGPKKPYAIPPRMLPIMPRIGHRIKGIGNENNTRIFKIQPTRLLLFTTKQQHSICIQCSKSWLKTRKLTLLYSNMSRESVQAKAQWQLQSYQLLW